jgi:type II secretory pathway component PulC
MQSRSAFALALLFAAACGENNALPPDTAWDSHDDMRPAAAAPKDSAPGALTRSAVREAVAAGLGAFLQRVELDVDRPVFENGKFHGFRILALRGDPRFWRGIDIHPGDVVTRVNGFSIERPEEAMQAFQSLEVASELRVAFDRDGQPRELAIPIVNDVAPAASAPAPAPAPAPAKH